jgi:phage I-like protein
MKHLITAALASSLASIGNEPPAEIVFLPEGEHQITATVDGKPKTITVNVPASKGDEIAQRLQSSLTERHAGNVRPHLAFQHQVGAASGIPQKFRYQPGKGVMLAVDWSGSGAAAIRNKDYSFFSPVFLMEEDGTPGTLPEKGEVGSLVNEPAFRSMPRIAAADAGAGDDRFYRNIAVNAGLGEISSEEDAKWALAEYGPDGNKDAKMREKDREAKATEDADAAEKELEKRARQHVASGEAASLEAGLIMAAQADGALYLTACAAPAIREETKEKLARLREASKPNAHEQLFEIASAFLKSGKAKDDDEAHLMACESRPDLFEQLEDAKEAAMKKSNPDPKKSATVGASDFEAKARNLVTAGTAATLNEALGLVAASDPSAYTTYLASLKG